MSVRILDRELSQFRALREFLSAWVAKVRPVFARIFGVDSRSLWMFRVALGLLMLLDIGLRVSDLGAFYTDEGLITRPWAMNAGGAWGFSLLYLNGSAPFVGAFFLFYAASALGFLIGYRTRLCNLLCLICYVSVFSRCLWIHQASDTLLCQLLFLSLGLPWKRTIGAFRQPIRLVCPATVGYLIFVSALFFFPGLFKFNQNLWIAGKGVEVAAISDFYGRGLGAWLTQHPRVSWFLNQHAIFVELVLPLFLYLPNERVRTLVLNVIATTFIGFGVFLRIGWFPLVVIIALIPLIPGWVWTRVLGGGKAGATIFPSRSGWGALRYAPLFYTICIVLYQSNAVTGQVRFPRDVGNRLREIHLAEPWYMFSSASHSDGWFEVEGDTKTGTRIDLLPAGERVGGRPVVPSRAFKNQRWLKFLENVRADRGLATTYANWLCRQPTAEGLQKVVIRFHPKAFVSNPVSDYRNVELLAEVACG
jgi:hypothetical protein